MSITQGPNTAGNGNLILSMDMYNTKSYSGPAITNIATAITPLTSSGTGYSFTSGTETVNIPGLGTQSCSFVEGYNNYSSVSSNCCPALFLYINSVAVSPSTLYTYSIVYKNLTGYTHSGFMYRYEYNGATIVTEGGVHNTANRIHLGDDWYWAWGTFTTAATTNALTTYFFEYEYNLFNRFYLARVMITPGNYTGMHPRLWPAVATTRSNVGNWVDLTGNTSWTVNNSPWDTAGTVTFNGTNGFMNSANNTVFNVQTPTVEAWVKPATLNQNGFFFEKGTVNTQYSLFQEGTNIVWRQASWSQYTASSNMTVNAWNHVVGTYTSGTRVTYVNGTAVTSDSQSGVLNTNAGGQYIGSYNSGGYYYNGQIGMVKVYNRVLTATEVQRNYQAGRSRFGLS